MNNNIKNLCYWRPLLILFPVLTLVCPSLIAGTKSSRFENYKKRLPQYQKARSTRDHSIRVGPNVFKIQSVQRNNPDGTLQIEDGKGKRLPDSPSLIPRDLLAQSAWLDIIAVDVGLQKSQYDLGRVKLIHLKSDTIIYPSSEVIESGVIILKHVRGTILDRSMDFWMEVKSYHEEDKVRPIPIKEGASASWDLGELKLIQTYQGHSAFRWEKRNGLSWLVPTSQPRNPDNSCRLFLRWKGVRNQEDHQICGVDVYEKKWFPDAIMMQFGKQQNAPKAITLDIPLSFVDHLEIRPYSANHRFFFEEMGLPDTDQTPVVDKFEIPVEIHGKEGLYQENDALSSIQLELKLFRGTRSFLLSTHGRGEFKLSDTKTKDPLTFSTFLYRINGLNSSVTQFLILDSLGNPLLEKPVTPHSLMHHGWQGEFGVVDVPCPLENLGSIVVLLGS
ncbi:MAG TPA: hypothetical protein EYQ50_18980 [Verrucomicrobiales bacterium]|nr:hypothetical protein [Verrucomicrobiales bacterium]